MQLHQKGRIINSCTVDTDSIYADYGNSGKQAYKNFPIMDKVKNVNTYTDL